MKIKYDILEGFKKRIFEQETPNTARKYYSAVKNLLYYIQFNSLSEIKPKELEKRLIQIKGKNNFSAAKCGLKRLREYDNSLILPDESFFCSTSIHKRNHRKKAELIHVDKVKRTVNQINNKKLMLAYRLGMISGLRIFELAALEKDDIKFKQDGTITVNVRHGKGDKAGTVHCMKDDYVYTKLKAYVQEHEGKLFYGEKYMREKAAALGMECHDFRRIYAFQHKKELKEKENLTNLEANKVIQANLRHSRYKTTKRYLYSKKFV